MIYKAHDGQANYGESIGILLLDTFVPFIPGDVGNASTFPFPVRYQKIDGLTYRKLQEQKEKALPQLIEAGRQLERAGVKAVTADCGFMIPYQAEIAMALRIPVFTSSLLQVTFIEKIISRQNKVGIITAESDQLDDSLLIAAGASAERVEIIGMENKLHFSQAILDEAGTLNSEQVEKETVEAARELVLREPTVSAILLECSSLAPYAKAVQNAVQLPVFDYITMIEFVHRSLVKLDIQGFM
ncbi:aspartate/glutamate racemase family protein [Planococcus halotolerans]|uniref:aspartate/glutamate racemase family protein n=1 Tax=Planococcus halotolerans TaxID=2233542 RepID=UPI001092A6ED|nr:aspartate/glutamate racemase family protein [Planococcus halotolerans]QHJ71395.1 aspartate/glutamate racemase family protein [Planococcus halotolerans]